MRWRALVHPLGWLHSPLGQTPKEPREGNSPRPHPPSPPLQFPLPFLPPAPALGPTFLLGVALLLAGLVLFNSPLWMPAARGWVESQLAGDLQDGGGGSQHLAAG
jgi:hypothetical protein